MLEKGFVYLDEALPGVFWDSKYFDSDNFMGRRADGYRVNRIVMTEQAALALGRALERARERNLSFFVFDAYRPARAVADFCAWARDEGDTARKAIHYPNITKPQLIAEGYIAPKSGHSRGSAIDLTLCDASGICLDMGGIFDYMDPRSWHGNKDITAAQAENRGLLREIMLDSGFKDYLREWWHYSLKDEPYPDRYFDFEIE